MGSLDINFYSAITKKARAMKVRNSEEKGWVYSS